MIELSDDNITPGKTFSVATYEEYKEIGDANLFEEVIDDMMVEKYSDDKELTDYITSLSREDKRMAILSLLDGDNNLWVKLKSMISGDYLTKMEHIKDVVIMLRDYVKVGEVEKKKFGEVMTPLELVKEMLATLPDDVWVNPDLKWLDPANGTGPYPIMVIYKLMKGLESWEPDSEKRYKHIVENMIYTCELQSRNVFLWLCAVDPKDEYVTNTYWGSFLEEGFDKHMKDVWCVDEFDIVMGNPPYQELKEGNSKSSPLWNKFVINSFSKISKSGYLLMIHPDSWRNPKGIFKDVQMLLKSNKIIYLEMHDKNDGFKTFGATTTYDFYCVKIEDNDGFLTRIKDKDGNIKYLNLLNWDFIPNGMFDEFEKVISNDPVGRVKTLYSRGDYGNDKNHMSKVKTEFYKYPCIYYTYGDGSFKLYYSSKNDKHFGIKKVIWSNGGASTPIIDPDGEYGVMNFAYSIVSDEIEYLKKIRNAMITDKFLKLMSYSDGNSGVGGQRYNYKVISLFREDFWKEFI